MKNPEPTPSPPVTSANPAQRYPGQRLALIGLLVSCLVGVVGVGMSVVALVISARNGHRNPAAIAGIIIGAIGTLVLVLGVFYVIGVLHGTTGVCVDRPVVCGN